IVWLTGHADLRLSDQPGFASAVAAGPVVPVFIIDPHALAFTPPARLRRLHLALSGLEEDLGVPLMVRSGASVELLCSIAKETGAEACHFIADQPDARLRSLQRQVTSSLQESGVRIQRWDATLRPSLSREDHPLPKSFPEYAEIASRIALQPAEPLFARSQLRCYEWEGTEGLPPLSDFLRLASAATPKGVQQARALFPTSPPYEEQLSSWCTTPAVRDALDEYTRVGREEFADAHFGPGSAAADSLHSAAANWLVKQVKPSSALSLREAATRAFSPALASGVISPREILAQLCENGESEALKRPNQLWGRSSELALQDVVEWREWFSLQAQRELELQESGRSTGSDGAIAGDEREKGEVAFWRWDDIHLVRYLHWTCDESPSAAGAKLGGEHTSEDQPPAFLCLHGFAASCEQWERFVFALKKECSRSGRPMPDVYALDLLGFGMAEKPGLSYTQHLWEAQVVDFAVEVMGARPLVLVGNSIGGGIACGVASNLKHIVRGLVLCNSAGLILEHEEYLAQYSEPCEEGATVASVGAMTLEDRLSKNYAPVPLFGPAALELFGQLIVFSLFDRIPGLLQNIYSDSPSNADEATTVAISRGALSPGSSNVIGSGQKLPPQRPLNEHKALTIASQAQNELKHEQIYLADCVRVCLLNAYKVGIASMTTRLKQ
ncbi:MAG: hypothetical protein SGPRY_004845, partial [Prymnesium sp.]